MQVSRAEGSFVQLKDGPFLHVLRKPAYLEPESPATVSITLFFHRQLSWTVTMTETEAKTLLGGMEEISDYCAKRKSGFRSPSMNMPTDTSVMVLRVTYTNRGDPYREGMSFGLYQPHEGYETPIATVDAMEHEMMDLIAALRSALAEPVAAPSSSPSP